MVSDVRMAALKWAISEYELGGAVAKGESYGAALDRRKVAQHEFYQVLYGYEREIAR